MIISKKGSIRTPRLFANPAAAVWLVASASDNPLPKFDRGNFDEAMHER